MLQGGRAVAWAQRLVTGVQASERGDCAGRHERERERERCRLERFRENEREWYAGGTVLCKYKLALPLGARL